MSKSNYLEDKIINHVLRNVAYTPAVTVYIALYTSDPGEADTGTEVVGGSYARQTVAFSASSGGSTSNTAQRTFSALPSATITHVGLRDALTSGNLLYSGILTNQIITNSGDDVVFSIGSVVVTED